MIDTPTQASTPVLGGGDALILASSSITRAALLRGAGLAFRVAAPGVDEAALKQSLRAAGATADDVAVALAELKATRLSRRDGTAFVIGADQMVSQGETWFDKPADAAAARAQLCALRGRTHRLHTAVCVARDGAVIWRHVEQAKLSMRNVSDAFLAQYLDQAGAAVQGAAGGYRLEGLGVQLFDRVAGDYFAILGLPLLPLLDFLRQHGVVPQ